MMMGSEDLAHLWVSLDIIVSEDDVVGGTRGGRDDIEGILRLEALEVDAARHGNWQEEQSESSNSDITNYID
jgi:hypothetical protein